MSFTPIANMTRFQATSNGAALSTGVMTAVSIQLSAGLTVRKLSFVSATTAAGTPTHWGFALYSSAATPVLMAQTADQATAAWAANTLMPLSLASAVVIPKAGLYWAAVWVTATTVPTLLSAPAMTTGLLNSAGIQATDKPLAVTSGSGLTTTAPGTIVTGGTNSLVVPLVYVS